MLMGLLDQNSVQAANLEQRLMRAKDIETLWYLRSDLMLTVSEHRGEAHAKVQLDEITRMFDGQVAPGRLARPDRR